jgi:TRAP-type mannitol/chloroaromatic compound transport system substrate-binding protein
MSVYRHKKKKKIQQTFNLKKINIRIGGVMVSVLARLGQTQVNSESG